MQRAREKGAGGGHVGRGGGGMCGETPEKLMSVRVVDGEKRKMRKRENPRRWACQRWWAAPTVTLRASRMEEPLDRFDPNHLGVEASVRKVRALSNGEWLAETEVLQEYEIRDNIGDYDASEIVAENNIAAMENVDYGD
jgi:hypothetical protein